MYNSLPSSDVNFGAKTGGTVLPFAADTSVIDTDSSYVPSEAADTISKTTRWNTSEVRSSPSIAFVHSSLSKLIILILKSMIQLMYQIMIII